MRRGQSKRDGQVWAERWSEESGEDHLFLIVGQEERFYRLVSLEDGVEDNVLRRAIDQNAENWRRIA